MRRLFTSWWFWTGLAVAILVALFLFGLPLVVHFMRPWWVRIAFCVAIVAIWLTIAFFRWRRARRANTAIADELTKADPGDEEEKALARTHEDGDRLAPLRRRYRGATICTAGRGTSSSVRPVPERRPQSSIRASGFHFRNKTSRASAGPATSTSGSPTRPFWSIPRGATRRRTAIVQLTRAGGKASSACSRSTAVCSRSTGSSFRSASMSSFDPIEPASTIMPQPFAAGCSS